METENNTTAKHRFAQLKRWHIASVVSMALGILITLIGKSTTAGTLGAVLIIASIIFEYFFWRCPACHHNLQNNFNPKRCPWCKVTLR